MASKYPETEENRSKPINARITPTVHQAALRVVDGRPRDEDGRRFTLSDLVQEALRQHPEVAKALKAISRGD